MAKTATTSAKQYLYATGRRREAVARVRLHNPVNGRVQFGGVELKKGDVYVNGKSVTEYFGFFAAAPSYNKILIDTDTAGKYIFTVRAVGGGLSGQLDAMVLAIARVLDKMDPEKYHKLLRDKGYLTVDSRTRERRKVGNAGKARRKKSSPKR